MSSRLPRSGARIALVPTPAQIETALTNLRPEVLVLDARVEGESLWVPLDDPAVLADLARRAGVAYRTSSTWATYAAETGDKIPAGIEPSATALLEAAVVLGGVRHVVVGSDPALVRRLSAQQRREEDEQARWEADQETHRARLIEVIGEIEATYPDRLLADEGWLASGDRRNREKRAREWAAVDYGDVAAEQRVRTAVLNAVASADESRTRQVVPQRTAAFEAGLPRHAAALAARPAFAQASTKATRVAEARRYLAEADPLVPPAAVVERLVVGAFAAARAADLAKPPAGH